MARVLQRFQDIRTPLSCTARAFHAASTTRSKGARMLQVVDCHAGGEPARIVVGGVPNIPGNTMMDKRQHLMTHHDDLRKLLLQEPRGYPCQNANIILPPTHPEAAYGFVILEQGKVYPGMSGHNTMCVATALLETGMVPMEEPTTEFTLEAPVGLVKIVAQCEGGKARGITFTNCPAFAVNGGKPIDVEVPNLGTVPVRLAFGGMWYAIVNAADVGLELRPRYGKDICKYGEMIKVATRERHPVNHPLFDYPGPDILCFRGPPSEGSGAHGRNAVVMTNVELDWSRPETWTGMIDRSPCGSGTSAVMATMHACGELKIGEDFIHESIVGSKFTGRLLEETTVAGMPAVIPCVSGQAWITQFSTIVLDPTDPFPEGYMVGDIWGGE